MHRRLKWASHICFRSVKSYSWIRYVSSNANSLYNWNSRITSYFKKGDVEAACKLFDEMPQKNVVTWNCMISGYIRNGMINPAQKVFDAMPSRNVVSWTAMLSGYAKNGNLEVARRMFDGMDDKNVVCWNSMISGYVSNGRLEEGRELFDLMQIKNDVSWAIMIEGYFRYGDVSEAERLFSEAPVKSVPFCNAMLAGYAEMRRTEDADKLFMRMDTHDVASWTSMITCFSRAREVEKARSLFDDMPEKDVVAWTAMIQGYCENNNIEEAEKLFAAMPHRDIIAWNSMLSGYLQNGKLQDALHLFHKMPWQNTVSWNLMLWGYVQQDDITNARELFEQMPRKDETSWNTMVSGYQNEEALLLYVQMLRNNYKPDQSTFSNVVSLCGVLALHAWGRTLHACVTKSGFQNDTMITSAFISMYSRCGFINAASSLFRNMKRSDTIAWNAMIVSQACHGSAKEALDLFPCMIQAGYEPDHVTFLGVLTACAHSGLVDMGWSYFISMEKRWSIIPKAEHYNCMVDLLGRSGMLAEAFELVKQIPVDLPAHAWETLLSCCRVHENFDLGDLVAQKLLSLQPSNIGMCVLLSNMYSARGMWKDAARVRALLKKLDLKKELACSWIEINGCISQFVSNERCNPRAKDIYKELKSLSALIEDSGTVMYQGCYSKFSSSEEINVS
ncbi:PREDICTED: pentatricopeptide repeat-containing protein At4g02750-like [Nicotiana attenuata]|uniref:Pentatricopeptide repeat-containing protein n=1 Tax=Nicotiana attenuata TaxID=49451 RepID=A0A1J6KK45_NICAT|nr:PREDICTED: pentatricopeptide repeat-containing protein At4g02750-like [Nicotiana attenuata]XP_019237823.1 PREDICTED: pentatricopeptide repeat-containing protein At4g02750-like [Nicotiana attenuata]OIT22159.1 pentatricopeptide repeat-containing protein [Nicotiana attenuata]